MVERNIKEFLQSREKTLEDLVNGKRGKLPSSVAIMVLATLNFEEEKIPAKLLSLVDYEGTMNKEDSSVLEKVIGRVNDKTSCIDIDRTTRIKYGGVILQYNLIRGFRPKGGAIRSDIALDAPIEFDKNGIPIGFNYTREDIGLEKFATICPNGIPVDCIFNKYPFAPGHFLYIPDRTPLNLKDMHNQYLNPDLEKDSEILESALKVVMNGEYGTEIRLGYNSQGAHASANHLHFQGFFITKKWAPPLEKILNNEKFNEKIDSYFPGAVWIPKSNALPDLKEFIRKMNEEWERRKNDSKLPCENVAYNFYITPNGVACFPRKHQGDKEYFDILKTCEFTTGYAFMEMCGEVISPTSNISIFHRKDTADKIRKLYDAASLK